MLGRSITSRSAITSTRFIHTTRPSLGFLGWLDFKKEQEKKPASTTEIMKKAEEDKLEVTKVDKIEFIGKDIDPRELIPVHERLNGFRIQPWLNKKKVTVENLDQVLIEAYESVTKQKVSKPEEISLEDLQFRFDYTKKLQELSGYIIPDHILTRAINASMLQKFFIESIFTGLYYKKNPDSLSHEELKQKGFTAANIYIESPVSDAEAKKKYKRLLKKAKKQQTLKSEQLIEEARG